MIFFFNFHEIDYIIQNNNYIYIEMFYLPEDT